MTWTVGERYPMSTAPRDGTLIVVGADDAGAFPMRWNPEGTNRLVQHGKGLWEAQDGSFTWSEASGHGPEYWSPIYVN